MIDSFTLRREPGGGIAPGRLLVTGAAGNIGRHFAEASRDRYELRLMVRDASAAKAQPLRDCGEVVEADLEDAEALQRACDGVEAVVHLAANPNPSATWDKLRGPNILGAYHMALAALEAGCRKFVYASSIHAVSGHPRSAQVKTSDPVNPGDLYGVTKCFGEALCRYIAEQEGMACYVIRIGAYQPVEAIRKPGGLWMADAFVAPEDLVDLIHRCLEDERLQFAIFNGLSGNRFNRLDITDAKELVGYQPKQDAFQLNEALAPLHLEEKVRAHNVRDPQQKDGLRRPGDGD